MKTMTCNQLGGACEEKFSADTFEEIAELSKQHGMAMFQQHDAAHLAAMEKMRAMMQEEGAMKKWYAERQQAFEELPDNNG